LEGFAATGSVTALPAIVGRDRPLEFRRWRPGAALERGPFGIAQPRPGETVRPDLLLVPLLGFDDACYRLGFGGGYYDRTLAALVPKPLAVGVGFELGRLASIVPAPHDMPMDAIVTERGAWRRPTGGPA
jgi:5-formyltetrahydrofolate cyclo-ligase